MKLKSIVFVMTCLLALGVSANVFAVSDTVGEAISSVPGEQNVDLASGSVQISDIGVGGTGDRANLGISMAAGSHLPAVMLFDFDVDNDLATGGGSAIGALPARQCGPGICKPSAGGQAGFDFYVNIILRGQGDGSALVNCSGALDCGGGSCTTRGTPGAGCSAGSDCFELGDDCNANDPDCYETSGACDGCSNSNPVYQLTNACGTTPLSCERPYVKGEWNVGFGQNGRVMNGNVNLPIGWSAKNEADICVEIPWALIIAEAHTAIVAFADPDHLPFDPFDSADINNPKFQVTALWDPTLPFDGGDFRAEDFPPGTGFNYAVRDWMPDTVRVADGELNTETQCLYNQEKPYADADVDGNDLTNFLVEFGRGSYDRPCPNCTE